MGALVLKESDPQLWQKLPRNGLFVIPTDTLLGISCLTTDKVETESIRRLKKTTNPNFITLIRNWEDLDGLASANELQRETLKNYWPGPISFILPGKSHSTVALRMPNSEFLRAFMDHVGGPIISTSCNLHERPPADNIEKAIQYFGEVITAYITPNQKPDSLGSTIVDLTKPNFPVLRQGDVTFPKRMNNR